MIGTKELFEFYKEEQKKETLKINKDLQNLETQRQDCIRNIEKYSTLVDRFWNFKCKEHYKDTTEIVFPEPEDVSVAFVNYQIDEVKKHFLVLVNLNNQVEEKFQLKAKKTGITSYKTYAKILDEFNKRLVDELIKGYHLNLTTFGKVGIQKKKRKGMNIDWNESNKRKAQLIAEGKTPYKILGYDENKKPISNGGEEYRSYHTGQYHYWLAWNRTGSVLKDYEKYPFGKYIVLKLSKTYDKRRKNSLFRKLADNLATKTGYLNYDNTL